jgi:SnoaL-like domain
MNVTKVQKCVVCNWEIPSEGGVKIEIENQRQTVCCDECAAIAKDKEQILCHVRGLFQAFIRKDLGAIQKGHTTDWKGFQVTSTKLVRGIDGYMQAAQEAMRSFNGTRYEILDLDIDVHADLAVVFYVARYWFVGAEEEQNILVRAVDLYRREQAGWNQCGSNICTIAG